MSTKSLIFGDKVLFVIILLLSLFSFFPVFSSSSYLSYVIDGSSPIFYLVKHFIVILFGLLLMMSIKLVPHKLFKGMSIILLPVGLLLLIYTLSQGTTIGGSAASRWIDIPFVGISFLLILCQRLKLASDSSIKINKKSISNRRKLF